MTSILIIHILSVRNSVLWNKMGSTSSQFSFLIITFYVDFDMHGKTNLSESQFHFPFAKIPLSLHFFSFCPFIMLYISLKVTTLKFVLLFSQAWLCVSIVVCHSPSCFIRKTKNSCRVAPIFYHQFNCLIINLSRVNYFFLSFFFWK